MYISRWTSALISAGILWLFCQEGNAQTRREIILDNPSFEETEKLDTPAFWWGYGEKGSPEFHMLTDEDGTAHSGKGCLFIQGNDADSIASWIYKGGFYVDARNAGYKIKGGTSYEFSAWVKSEGITNSPVLTVWEMGDGKPMESHNNKSLKNGSSPWHKVTYKFTTKANCDTLQLRLVLAGKGRIWFDDVELSELTDSNKPGSPNLLKNSSFEITTVPLQADNWGQSGGSSGVGGVVGAHYTEKFFDWFRTDDSVAFHGKNSFKLHKPFNNSDPDASDYFAGDFIFGSDWHLCGEIEEKEPYTLSCYMKGDLSGLKVKMELRGFESKHRSASKEVEISDSWQRYSMTIPGSGNTGKWKGTIPPHLLINFSLLQKGTVWIDAVQLEKGEKVTPYAPSCKDDVTMGKNVLPPVPNIVCEKVLTPPVLDGKLDDAVYSKLPVLNFVQTNGQVPREATEGYIFQDGENLYIAMRCHETEMNKLRLKIRDRDGDVWTDDSVEIFIDPELSGESYYRLSVNADGVKFDGRILDGAWNGEWDARTFKGKNFWSLEMKIPLHCFGVTPATDTTWGINLCRNNTVVMEYSNWSTVYDGGFHCPKRFGRINGIDITRLKAYCYNLGGIALAPRLDGNGYDVSANLSNFTSEDKEVVLDASVIDGNKETSASSKIDIKKGEMRKVKVGPFKMESKAIDRVDMKLMDLHTGKILRTVSTSKLKVPGLFELVPELNYYTDESNASIFILNNAGKSAVDSSKMSVRIKVEDSSGAVLLTKDLPFSDKMSSVDIPIGKFKCGDYSISADLIDSTGKVIANATDILRKLPSNSSCVKVNRMNRMLVIAGKSIIPIGQVISVFLSGTKENRDKSKAFYDKIMASYSKDFNSICIYYYGPNENIPDILDIAQKNNLKVFWGCFQNFDYSEKSIRKQSFLMKDHPAFIAWPEILDEAVANEKKANTAFDRLKWIRRADPYHIQYIRNHCVSFASWEKFGYPGEVLEYHDYAFSSNRRGIATWAPYMKLVGTTAQESRRPFLAMPQSFSSMQWWSRGPTADEMEASVYLALINGSTIIQYYIFDQAERNLWLRVRNLNKEIGELTPVLASYDPSPEIGTSSSKIQTLVKNFNGHYYILAVNSSPEPVVANLDISVLGLSGDLNAKLLFENREIKVKDGLLKDTFAGYSRHVYMIAR